MGIAAQALQRGEGIFSMIPAWVPRAFNLPGKRLRLHPDDYYALGLKRGAIVERWFSSVTPAANEGAPADEGMSYVAVDENQKLLFKDAIGELGADLIGEALMKQYGTWPMYSKFYDYMNALFHHIHHGEEAAKRVGQLPKHEHYFFPPQYNNHPGNFPISYFGFDPSVTRDEVKARLQSFESSDGRITELSRAFRLQLGTGWYTPAAVVHAPGSLLTYEPQWNSDVFATWENIVSGEVFPYESFANYLPKGSERDLDAIIDVADWELNTCADYRERYFRPPVEESSGEGFSQNWVAYGNPYVAAKELTVAPGASVVIRDKAAYGCIVVQGYGAFGPHACEAVQMVRYGQRTADEFFVSEKAALEGVRVVNKAKYEPLVILKHFGPNCGMPQR